MSESTSANFNEGISSRSEKFFTVVPLTGLDVLQAEKVVIRIEMPINFVTTTDFSKLNIMHLPSAHVSSWNSLSIHSNSFEQVII
jgi:hypothetical protein